MSRLFDREAELDRLQDLLDEAARGVGHLVVVRGAAGVGKTSVLDELRVRARTAGMHSMQAQGGEFEKDFAFGVVRQLAEPAIAGLEGSVRARVLSGVAGRAQGLLRGGGEDDAAISEQELFHSLYWLFANLAAEAPLVITIDDAQWGDTASMSWLRYLARRIDHLPILVAIAVETR